VKRNYPLLRSLHNFIPLFTCRRASPGTHLRKVCKMPARLRLEQLEARTTPSFSVSTLASFVNPNGAHPAAGLVMDGKGNLFGTTSDQGPFGVGTVFEFAQGSSTITTLASFTGVNGANPGASLLLDSGGNLYGTTTAGGANGKGTVFELIQGSSTITTLASFGGSSGLFPDGGLVLDNNGNLFGTTVLGGTSNNGTVFEWVRTSGAVITLASFRTTNGADPEAALIRDSSGNLYGTTKNAEVGGLGTIFELHFVAVTLSPKTLPPATVGTAYSQTLTVQGAIGTATFAVTVGSLPAGLTLSSTGLLSGTPTAAGDAHFTVTATDTAGEAGSQSYSLASNPATFSINGFHSPTTAGVAGIVTVTALDSNGRLVPSYTGTVHFTSSDGQAVLPVDYTFVPSDQGVHNFTITLKSAGSQSIGVADTVWGAIHRAQTIRVIPASVTHFLVAQFPSLEQAGVTSAFQVTAQDVYDNTVPSYTGTVHFTTTDPNSAVRLPPDYTFIGGDRGDRVLFHATLDTAGTQSITAIDTVNTNITGSQTGIMITPAALHHFRVYAIPNPTLAGAGHTVSVAAKDIYGNIINNDTGTVAFRSTDPLALLPSSYAFAAADAGMHTFGVILKTAGTQSISVTDTLSSTVTGQEVVTVRPGAAKGLRITGPIAVMAGTPQTYTVTAYDAWGNAATGDTGTVHLRSSDAAAGLPADYTFTTADAGVHIFTNGVTFHHTSSNAALSAIDTLFASIRGSFISIVVT
jgi:uncharacterized repeat protein (TIGR03803 family)